MKQIDKKDFIDACSSSNGTGEVLRKLNLVDNGTTRKYVKELSKKYNIKLPLYKKELKYEIISKKCPVCGKVFSTQKGHDREKTVCSRACSNTYFRSGENNPNYINGNGGENEYRVICFEHHDKKCCICGFDYIVEVHHMDCNKNNNNPNNLIPLCPNHHRMFHSKHRGLVQPSIEEYIRDVAQK